MCQDMGFRTGVWLRQDDGLWFRVARVTPAALTCFDHRMEIHDISPDRYRREGFLRATGNPVGTDFSPFRYSTLPWTRQTPHGLCGVEGCGREATERWLHAARPSNRFAPAVRTTWNVCPEHWFFPNDYQEALNDWEPGESRFTGSENASVVALIRHLVGSLEPPVPPPPESDVSIFDAILDDD